MRILGACTWTPAQWRRPEEEASGRGVVLLMATSLIAACGGAPGTAADPLGAETGGTAGFSIAPTSLAGNPGAAGGASEPAGSMNGEAAGEASAGAAASIAGASGDDTSPPAAGAVAGGSSEGATSGSPMEAAGTAALDPTEPADALDPTEPGDVTEPPDPTESGETGEDPSPSESVSALEFFHQSGLGWNLGNSLDAPEGETAWGNPVVSETLLRAVAQAGFDVVRIPVTWSQFMGAGPDYVIDAARLERVEEVVGYALDNGLRAIVNVHHDGADAYEGVEWLSLNDADGQVSETHNAAVRAQFVAVWRQIAEHFADYGPELLFESMNEIHDGYDAPATAYYTIINELNQAFVDTVRASGGNNTARYLIVPGYNTNIDYTLEGFALPADTVLDKLALSVHFYDPWSFAGEASTATWGSASPGSDSWGQEDYVVAQFDRLQAAYVQQGVPVMIGEYGAVNQTGSEDYRRYYMEYVTQAACLRGFLPVYWDNGGLGSGADSFGLFDRTAGTVAFPEILAAMLRASTSHTGLETIAPPG